MSDQVWHDGLGMFTCPFNNQGGKVRFLVMVLSLLCMITLVIVAAADSSEKSDQQEKDVVHIRPNGISMPLDRIILLRKGEDYCAIKFIRFWDDGKGDIYSSYESYSFVREARNTGLLNFKLRKRELRSQKPQFFLFGHPVAFGTVDEIECGFCSPWWSGLGSVYFFERGQPQGDHGMELSPTKWTDVSQVNLFDPRLKWYRYDEARKRVDVPVDDLW
jgi:hypothetical protein